MLDFLLKHNNVFLFSIHFNTDLAQVREILPWKTMTR